MSEARSRAGTSAKRDLMGHAFFVLHFLIMIYFVAGWLAPWRAALIFYLIFIPFVMLQWRYNKGACILNNLESLIRYGTWRHHANTEEGAWLATLCHDLTGFRPTARQVDIFTHTLLVLLWALGLGHLLRL